MSEETTESGLPPEVEAKFKSDGLEYVVIKTKAGVCAFRPLKRAEYQRFQTMIRDPKAAPSSSEQVCSFAVIYPALNIFQGYLEKYPGILTKCADEVLDLSGVDMEAETSKSSSV